MEYGIACILLTLILNSDSMHINSDKEENCKLPSGLLREISSYQPIADRIIATAVNGQFRGRTYNELANFVDKFVNRISGSQMLEDSIDYMMAKMVNDGLVNVRGEPIEAPRWIRGEEKAFLLEPARKKLEILGLGPSVATPENGLIAEVIVVKSFDDLEKNKDFIRGKIVVYNQGWLGSYPDTVTYRGAGSDRASQYGAIAALIESVGPFSMNTPHTGHVSYEDKVPRIPAACITKEDAEMLYRMYSRGDRIVIHLTMLDQELPPVISRNVIGEIRGRESPNEIVAVSGHIDAWDVGQGAMDDAGGALVSTEAISMIKYLGLVPRRTLQAILWTSEEFGLFGVKAFANQHRAELHNYNAVLESDSGAFKPRGVEFAGSPEAGCIVKEVVKLLAPINATNYERLPHVASDITVLTKEGVPAISLKTEDEQYFHYHHTGADMLYILNSDDLDLDTPLWATVSYVLSDLSVSLPRVESNQK